SEARAAREDPVTWGLYWTEATILQAQRVRQYFLWSRSVGRSHNINETTGRLEELNLLTAANKARRWIEYADCPMWDVAAVEPFLTLLKKAKFVRDKREHDEEYGRGGKPHPLTDATSKRGGPTIKVSPGV